MILRVGLRMKRAAFNTIRRWNDNMNEKYKLTKNELEVSNLIGLGNGDKRLRISG